VRAYLLHTTVVGVATQWAAASQAIPNVQEEFVIVQEEFVKKNMILYVNGKKTTG
jgi:hypothetical protein